VKPPDVRYLAEFLEDLADAIDSGRWFSVEKLSDGEPYTVTLTGMPFRLGARYRIVYPPREIFENRYPPGETHAGEYEYQYTYQYASRGDAEKYASPERIECVHYREVIDRENTT